MNKSTPQTLVLIPTALMTASYVDKGGRMTQLDTAGAAFPLSYCTEAFKTYEELSGVHVNYSAVGSGDGIRSFKDEVVDFAASDAFLSDEELAEMPREAIHIPTCIGAVVIAYSCPEVTSLQLTGEVVANIYLGEITHWNDPAIAAINPDQRLPDREISPVYRFDGSGTTNVFSDYLTKMSPDWVARIGTGKSPKWPTGMAARGNPGVADVITQTDGALGCMGSECSFSLDIPIVKVQDQTRDFVPPSLESIFAAVAGEVASGTQQAITSSAHPEAYPVGCLTWLITYEDLSYSNHSEAKVTETARLLNWMLSNKTQAITSQVHPTPLSPEVLAAAKAQLAQLTYSGNPTDLTSSPKE